MLKSQLLNGNDEIDVDQKDTKGGGRMLVGFVENTLRLQEMVQPGQTVAAALSGGRDSVCLLHVLHRLSVKLSFKLMAIHVHHGLREEADADEAFCRELCSRWGIPLLVTKVDTPARVKETGESVEEAARNLRYTALEELVKTGTVHRIALAHHQQDQAETVLLHLLRGSGLTGLCGMRAKRLPYIRPLLEVSADEIEKYLKENDLPHVEDVTNHDTAYRRNHIRHQLLPLLQQEYNPEIVRALAQMAANLQEEETYLERQTPDVSEEISIGWLLQYPVNLQKRILRKWLRKQGLMQDVQQVHIEQLLELAKGQTGRRISLPKGLTAQKSYDILVIHRSVPCPALPQGFPSFQMEYVPLAQAMEQWDGQQQVPALPEEKWLSADALSSRPEWRTRRRGDYIVAAGGRKKLKDFLIDAKVPREERDRLPLLADGAHVLWVFGYRISDDVRITENTQQVLHVRRI